MYSQPLLRSCLIVALVRSTLGQVPPGNPIITAPTAVVIGNSVTLSCASTGGNPVPNVLWYRGTDAIQLVDSTATTVNGVTTNNYTFTADKSHHRAVFECQVDNNILQNPLTSTWFFEVYTAPSQPSLTGPNNVTAGTTYQWTCTSTGGYPAPIMTLRIGNTQITTGITPTSVLQADSSYTVTSALSWVPSITYNGNSLYCDVKHQQTNSLQTASKQLTVNAAAVGPITGAATSSERLTAGEIAAIILAILFFLLLLLLLLYCCCKGYCAGICGGKKEKVTPQPARVEIPRFYEKPVAIIEQPAAEYEINKYVILKPDHSQQIESRSVITTASERGLDNIYVTTSDYGQNQIRGLEYTYAEEERRRRRHRKKKKKSSRRYHKDDQSIENEIVVADEMQTGRRSHRSDREVLHSSRNTDYYSSRNADY